VPERAGHRPDDPAKIQDAAEQFEALLLVQMLRAVRESGSGWLGSGAGGAGDCATEFAEQHVAACLAKGGGMGLARLIARGLQTPGV
jgi:Rod binding domain-containing protein